MNRLKALAKKLVSKALCLAGRVAALPIKRAARLGAKRAGRTAHMTLRMLRPVVLGMAVFSALSSILLAALYICSKEE